MRLDGRFPEQWARFKLITSESMSVDPVAVVFDAAFIEDFDADSLDLMELIMALESEFQLTIPEGQLEGIDRIDQAFELVIRKLGLI